DVAPIVLGDTSPIPSGLTVSAPATTLTTAGQASYDALVNGICARARTEKWNVSNRCPACP
ncbi:MAG: hypothetical protein ABSD56_07230, partial [Bryobacteraceae bacterium]